MTELNLCLFGSVRGERPEWKFYNVLEKIICRKDSTEQEDGINDVSIPEESPGQQAEDDTDWDVLGHVGLEGTHIVHTICPANLRLAILLTKVLLTPS